MSEAARKSHIPDDQLASLTTEKLHELERERNELAAQLSRTATDASVDSAEHAKLAKRLDNHIEALDKLESYRQDMLEDKQ